MLTVKEGLCIHLSGFSAPLCHQCLELTRNRWKSQEIGPKWHSFPATLQLLTVYKWHNLIHLQFDNSPTCIHKHNQTYSFKHCATTIQIQTHQKNVVEAPHKRICILFKSFVLWVRAWFYGLGIAKWHFSFTLHTYTNNYNQFCFENLAKIQHIMCVYYTHRIRLRFKQRTLKKINKSHLDTKVIISMLHVVQLFPLSSHFFNPPLCYLQHEQYALK